MMRNRNIRDGLTSMAMPLLAMNHKSISAPAEAMLGKLAIALATQSHPASGMTKLTPLILRDVFLAMMVNSFAGIITPADYLPFSKFLCQLSGDRKIPYAVETGTDAAHYFKWTSESVDSLWTQAGGYKGLNLILSTPLGTSALSLPKIEVLHFEFVQPEHARPDQWPSVSTSLWYNDFDGMALSVLSHPNSYRLARLSVQTADQKSHCLVRVWRRQTTNSTSHFMFCPVSTHRKFREWVAAAYPPLIQSNAAPTGTIRGVALHLFHVDGADEPFVRLDWLKTAFVGSWYACESSELMRLLHDAMYIPYLGRLSLQKFFSNPDRSDSVDINHLLCLPLFLCHILGWGSDDILVPPPS